MTMISFRGIVVLALAATVAGCTGGEAAREDTPAVTEAVTILDAAEVAETAELAQLADAAGASQLAPDGGAPGVVEAGPEPSPEVPATPAAAEAAPAARGMVLTVAPTGNETRYRVREVLVGFELPSDAIGRTGAVTGSMALGPSGEVLPGSTITVNITGLRSDSDRRDGFLQSRVLDGAQFPTVQLRPTALRGIAFPLPSSGSANGVLVGDLTIRDVTRPTNWQVDARFSGDRVTGTASTAFTFDDFGLTKPRVPAVLSVADTIRLEYDFEMVAGE